MIRIRKSEARGYANHGWLKSYHTFSFASYHDPEHMGFRALRVINDDWIGAGQGFGTHPHRDMEIVTYVLQGSLEHRDSLGTGSVLRHGDVQRMSAGTGVTHSEFNHSTSEDLHLLQIWLLPERSGITPGYEEKNFPAEEKQNQLRLLASRDARNGSLTIHQDVDLYAALLEPGQEVRHSVRPGRHAWLQVAAGAVTLNGEQLSTGDAAAVSAEDELVIGGVETAEILLFDLG